jgi:hypothetical protein
VNTVKYILDALGNPRPETDLKSWLRWYENADRVVACENIGKSRVSTVFLGLDYAWNGGEPLLWETMVFGGPMDQEMDRCSGNREQAEAMHLRMIERVQVGGTPNPR